MVNLTDAELERTILRAYEMARSGVFAKSFKEFDAAGPQRVNGQTKLLEACIEAAKRGILRDIQARHTECTLPHYAPNRDLHETLAAQRGWVANRGFKIDHELVKCLEELLAFRHVLRRQELTGEDIDQELRAITPNSSNSDETWESGFCHGLRRGFAMRAEERQPTTTPTQRTA